MLKDKVISTFLDCYKFSRALSNRLSENTKLVEELNEHLKDHPEFETIRHLIRCICEGIELPTCRECGKTISFSKRTNQFCSMNCKGKNAEVSKKISEAQRGFDKLKKKEIRDKIKKTNLKKYGCECALQNEEVKKKCEETNLRKYGVRNVFEVMRFPNKKHNKEKTIKTNLEKYGTEWGAQSEVIKKKMKETMLKKHGVEYPMQSKELVEKSYDKNNKTLIKAWNTILSLSGYVIPLFSFNDYVLNRKNLRWKCVRCGNEFTQDYSKTTFINPEFERTPRCLKCFPKSKGTSNKEKELMLFCESHFSDCQKNDRSLIKPFELDIVISKIKLAIEFNGNFYHQADLLGFNYHLNKTKLCNDAGYRLIHIWEDEWDTNKEDIKRRLCEIFEGRENLMFEDFEIKLDKSWYNCIEIPGYSLANESNPSLVNRGGFNVENCGWMTFHRDI